MKKILAKKILIAVCLLAAFSFSTAALAESRADITGPTPLMPNAKLDFTLRLTGPDGQPLTEKKLQTVHTKKIHLLVIDDSMTDYRHVHPAKTKTPGVYSFSFKPKTLHNYAVWVDIARVGGEEEYLRVPLAGAAPCQNCVNLQQSLQSLDRHMGVQGALSFDGDMAMLHLTDAHGSPVTVLEPVMGAFAHFVAFYADGSGVMHMHPMGDEPKDAFARGGPDLMFHLAPQQRGTVKAFAQVKIGGKDVYLPFTFDVIP